MTEPTLELFVVKSHSTGDKTFGSFGNKKDAKGKRDELNGDKGRSYYVSHGKDHWKSKGTKKYQSGGVS